MNVLQKFMDILSHGIWGALGAKAFNKKSRAASREDGRLDPLLAFAWGVLPDFVAFAPIFLLLVGGWIAGQIDPMRLPRTEDLENLGVPLPAILSLTSIFYSITHSLIVFAFAFFLIILVRRSVFSAGDPMRRPPWEMFAWLFHLLLDIVTHGREFYPTPFLWPLSDFHVNGVPWSHPWVFFTNWGLLLLGFLVFRGKRDDFGVL